MLTGGRFTMNVVQNLQVGIEVLSPCAKHALVKDLASLIVQTSTVKEFFSIQTRNIDLDVKEGEKREFTHKFQRQNPVKENEDDTDSDTEVLTEHETKKLSKAARTVK